MDCAPPYEGVCRSVKAVDAGVAYEPPLGHSLTAFDQQMGIRMTKDILRLKYQGRHSHERIAQSRAISKGDVSKYLAQPTSRALHAHAELGQSAAICWHLGSPQGSWKV